jgi:hypothetical protein
VNRRVAEINVKLSFSKLWKLQEALSSAAMEERM